jgi:hypothetical protein
MRSARSQQTKSGTHLGGLRGEGIELPLEDLSDGTQLLQQHAIITGLLVQLEQAVGLREELGGDLHSQLKAY